MYENAFFNVIWSRHTQIPTTNRLISTFSVLLMVTLLASTIHVCESQLEISSLKDGQNIQTHEFAKLGEAHKAKNSFGKRNYIDETAKKYYLKKATRKPENLKTIRDGFQKLDYRDMKSMLNLMRRKYTSNKSFKMKNINCSNLLKALNSEPDYKKRVNILIKKFWKCKKYAEKDENPRSTLKFYRRLKHFNGQPSKPKLYETNSPISFENDKSRMANGFEKMTKFTSDSEFAQEIGNEYIRQKKSLKPNIKQELKSKINYKESLNPMENRKSLSKKPTFDSVRMYHPETDQNIQSKKRSIQYAPSNTKSIKFVPMEVSSTNYAPLENSSTEYVQLKDNLVNYGVGVSIKGLGVSFIFRKNPNPLDKSASFDFKVTSIQEMDSLNRPIEGKIIELNEYTPHISGMDSLHIYQNKFKSSYTSSLITFYPENLKAKTNYLAGTIKLSTLITHEKAILRPYSSEYYPSQSSQPVSKTLSSSFLSDELTTKKYSKFRRQDEKMDKKVVNTDITSRYVNDNITNQKKGTEETNAIIEEHTVPPKNVILEIEIIDWVWCKKCVDKSEETIYSRVIDGEKMRINFLISGTLLRYHPDIVDAESLYFRWIPLITAAPSSIAVDLNEQRRMDFVHKTLTISDDIRVDVENIPDRIKSEYAQDRPYDYNYRSINWKKLDLSSVYYMNNQTMVEVSIVVPKFERNLLLQITVDPKQ